MIARTLLGLALAAIAACSSPAPNDVSVGSTASHDTTVRSIDQEVEVNAPLARPIYVKQMVADYAALAVEYDVLDPSHASPTAIVYRIEPSSPRPLRVEASDAAGNVVLALAMDAVDLDVLAADGSTLFSVHQFASGGGAASADAPLPAASADAAAFAVYAMQAILPAQQSLTFPPLAQNRRFASGGGDVVGSAADAKAIVEWSAPFTLLGALFSASARLSVAGGRLAWSQACPDATSLASFGSLSCAR
jgi:hypothetical protein